MVQEAFARLAESRRPTATAEPPEAPGGSPDPADRVILHDEVRRAISVVIGRLSPAERTSFILHDVFGFPFDGPGGTRAAGLAERFIAVCDGGDMHELIGLLDPGAAGSPVVIGLGPMPGVRGAKAVAGRAMT